jgi:hypothetical protein
MVIVKTPSFKSAWTDFTAIGSGKAKARENWP